MKRWINILGLSLLALVLIALTSPDLLLLPGTLLFGWFHALRRIVSAMVASPGALAWAGLAIALIVAGTHWFGLWVWSCIWPNAVSGDGSQVVPKWRWRWTLTFHGALAIVLFAAMSVVGVAHQTGWLIASREPIYVSRMRHLRDRAEMRSLARAIESTGVEQHWHAAAIRKHVWGRFREDNDTQERLHAVFLEGTNGHLARALIFPRNPKAFDRTGVAVVEPGAPFRTEQASALSALLQLHPPAAQTAVTTP